MLTNWILAIFGLCFSDFDLRVVIYCIEDEHQWMKSIQNASDATESMLQYDAMLSIKIRIAIWNVNVMNLPNGVQ